jgi:hypothetical protein
MGHDDDDVLWNGSEEDRNVRVNMTKMKALTDGNSDTDWQRKWNVTCFVYEVNFIHKYFFLQQMCYYGGGSS